MKKNQSFLIYPLLLMGAFLVFANSCKKDDDNNGDNNTSWSEEIWKKQNEETYLDLKGSVPLFCINGSLANDQATFSSITWEDNYNGYFSMTTTQSTAWLHIKKNGDNLVIGPVDEVYSQSHDYATYYKSTTWPCDGGGSGSSLTDSRDGNVYQTVKIGNQVWMAENLKYLPSLVGPGTGSETTPYYYVYGYTGTNVSDAKATDNYKTYGVLYNWPAAMNGSASSTSNPSGVQGVCPTGWHLPSDAEWTQLTDFLGGTSVAGGKLKESGTTHWDSPNTGATNSSGFSALPGGQRNDYLAQFYSLKSRGIWWTATEQRSDESWRRQLQSYDTKSDRQYYSKKNGFSVRCLKD